MRQLMLILTAALSLHMGLAWAGPGDTSEAADQHGDNGNELRITRSLATQGYVPAQFDLGVIYEDGRGVPADYPEALKWYRLAAAQGYRRAENKLGTAYAYGQGVPRDYARAHMWFTLASAQGDADAMAYREAVTGMMTPRQVAEARKLVRQCQRRDFKDCG